jgi:hypothetical protein
MSTKKKVTTFVVGPATARYPKLDQPYYYDKALKKSVADPAGKNKGSALTVELVMSEQDAAPLITKIREVAEEAGLDLDEVKNWPYSKEKDKETKKPTGNIIFKLKKYATAKDGSVNRVTFVDGKMRILPKDFRLTSGSIIKANGYFAVFTELGGGVSMRLDSAQVLKLVEREANLSGFGAVEDGYEFEADDYEEEDGKSQNGSEDNEGASDNPDF